MARLSLCRDKHLNPILDVHDDRVRLPVGLLTLIDNLKRLSEPINRGTDQLIRRDTELHPALTIRQFPEVGHAVRMSRTNLERIVETAIPPHAGHIMVRNVAVIKELTGQVLTAAAATFRFKVQRFRWADDFHVYTIGLRPDDRILYRTIRPHSPKIVGLGARASLPPNRPTMRMV